MDVGTKRGAGEAGLPAGSATVGGQRIAVGSSEFNDHFLRFFYSNLYPFKLMFRWLSYGNGAWVGCGGGGK